MSFFLGPLSFLSGTRRREASFVLGPHVCASLGWASIGGRPRLSWRAGRGSRKMGKVVLGRRWAGKSPWESGHPTGVLAVEPRDVAT